MDLHDATWVDMNNMVPEDDDMESFALSIDGRFWMLIWIFFLFIFIVVPFCASQRRRQLCVRRIRERRWIRDEGDEWYQQAILRRQARRQQLDDEQRRFATSRTQEDEIREQFLTLSMERYTLVSL
jgi:biopolymer transport protein ExbB/TolQ